MQAILLAAGKGTRISKNIPPIPKCTLQIAGVPLVKRTVQMLEKKNIRCTIVTGYKHEYIDKVLEDTDVKIVYNPFYDVTNSIGSLYMAKEQFGDDDLLVANADVFWTPEVLELILEGKEEVTMLSDASRADDGDYFFKTEDGLIKKYGKELARDDRDCEYVGIAKIDKSFVKKFKEQLIKMVSNQQHGVWWENVLYSLVNEEKIHSLDVDGRFWAEVDFIEDYNRILEYVKNNL